MPSNLALLLGLGFIAGLLIYDSRYNSSASGAIWLPIIWLCIISSRFVSQWLDPSNMWLTAEEYMEGSPLDRMIFLMLMLAGLIVLIRRRVSWSYIATNNLALVLFISFELLSITWSDFPFITFKRWIKAFGDYIMIMVVLTEKDPEDGIKTLIRRMAYILIPLSVLLIKYFPNLSRSFDSWTGMGYYQGVGTSKNMLGNLCLISGYYFIWNILSDIKQKRFRLNPLQFIIELFLLFLTIYTLKMADSATSLGTLIISTFLLILMGLPIIRRNTRYIGIFVITSIILFIFSEVMFDSVKLIINSLGRDMTFTTRTDIWAEVLKVQINPIIGTGFESFWLGPRLDRIWAVFWYHPNQSHNGYLEIYLTLGYIGLFLLLMVILNAFKHTRNELIDNFDFGRFRMVYIVILLAYNVTEAAIKGLSTVWFIFLVLTIVVPKFKPNDIYPYNYQ